MDPTQVYHTPPSPAQGGHPNATAPILVSGTPKKLDEKVTNVVQNQSPLSSSPNVSPNGSKNNRKYTTDAEVDRTLDLFKDFRMRMKVIMTKLHTEMSMPAFNFEPHKKLPSKWENKNRQSIENRRESIPQKAKIHQEILFSYRVYLGGIVEELALIKLDGDLESLDKSMNERNRPKVSSAPNLTTMETPTTSVKFPPSLEEAWNKLSLLGELKREFESLTGKFAFAKEGDFEKEYRFHEVALLLQKFKDFSPTCEEKEEADLEEWQREELEKLKAHIQSSYDALKKMKEESNFFKNSGLSKRVTQLGIEFEDKFVSQQVKSIRECNRKIQRLKEVISFENTLEHRRLTLDRIKIHQQRVQDLGELKKWVGLLDIGCTIETLKNLMDSTSKQRKDIVDQLSYTLKKLAAYDEKIKEIEGVI